MNYVWYIAIGLGLFSFFLGCKLGSRWAAKEISKGHSIATVVSESGQRLYVCVKCNQAELKRLGFGNLTADTVEPCSEGGQAHASTKNGFI